MKRAKTNKSFITIFSAILGVVFAFITGFTYCATSLNLIYGTKDNSTSAYMGNQQFHLVNDTVNNPVMFGEGSHNFEIALQYSFDYDFDLRVQYSLSWSNSASTDNVILNFANRDNIIYDENYIYLANEVTAGSGKLSLIAGVEFVDPTDKTYNGATLTITILDSNVKVYKAQSTYTGVPNLVKDVVETDANGDITTYDSVAAQTWHQYKMNITSTSKDKNNAYVMMYNYRRDYEHGIQYPGAETAYKKPVATKTEGNYTIDNVYGSVWTGGNRAYAGTGMYVMAGGTNLDLTVQVSGIWRTQNSAELTTENNIQYNYSSDWNFSSYSEVTQSDEKIGLWEVRTFTYYIEANTACYIDILDSVEITSAGISTTTEYRLVTNSIIVNSTNFAYSENSDISQFKQITSNTSSKTNKYTQETISVINTTKYNNGLYNSLAAEQTFNGNISLINNSDTTQSVSITYDLKYHISNGNKNLYDPNDTNKKRAIDMIDRDTNDAYSYTYQTAFSSLSTYSAVNTIYYSYTGSSVDNLSFVDGESVVDANKNLKVFTITIAPYSSVNLMSSYAVGGGLSSTLLSLFDTTTINTNLLTDEEKSKAEASVLEDNRNDYYDVWTYIEPTIKASDTSTAPNLTFETKSTASGTTVSVKNNTNYTITGINIEDFALKVYNEQKSGTITSQPHDWEASYWKYYPTGSTSSLTKAETFDSTNGYYTITKAYTNFTFVHGTSANYTLGTGFDFGTVEASGEKDVTVLYDTDRVLLPGESVDLITLNTTGTTGKFITTGTISTSSVSTESGITIINNGTDYAYIVNYSSNAYYLKISGEHSGTSFEYYNSDGTDDYTYYIGIVRPGQIIDLTMADAGTITTIKVDYSVNNGEFVKTQLSGWSSSAVADMEEYFNINKNNVIE